MQDIVIDLQLFADGAGASGGEGAAQGGAQDGQTTGDNSADAAQARAEEYARFKEQYRTEYDSEVQNIVQSRLKNANRQIEAANKYRDQTSRILETLALKYGGDVNDPDSLLQSIEADDGFYEEAAAERGLTVDQYKQFMRLESENKQFREAAERRQQQARSDSIYQEWQEQAAKTRQYYKGFDLQKEIQNPNFSKLLRSGVDVKTAFEVIHKDEIIPAAMQVATQKATQKVSNAVAANRARPAENGLGAGNAVESGVNIENLTREQMEDLKRRAARGELITFT